MIVPVPESRDSSALPMTVPGAGFQDRVVGVVDLPVNFFEGEFESAVVRVLVHLKLKFRQLQQQSSLLQRILIC